MPFYILTVCGAAILVIDLFTPAPSEMTRNIFLLWIALGIWRADL